MSEIAQNYKNALIYQAYGYFECNLTKDIVIGDFYKIVKDKTVSLTKRRKSGDSIIYSQAMTSWAKENILSNQRDFQDIASRDNLLQRFENDILSSSVFYWAFPGEGKPICLEQTFLLSRNEDGDVLAFCIVKDVSDRERNRTKTAQMDAMLNGITSDYESIFYIDLNHDSYFSYRTSKTLQACIKKTEARTHFSEQAEALLDMFVVKEDRMKTYARMQKDYILNYLEREPVLYIEFKANVDGTEQFYRAKFTRDKNSQSGNSVILGLSNVDDERRAELKQQELQNRQKTELEQATAKANAANAAKSRFLFNMSHDIRTPMNAILGFAAMARKYIDNKAQALDYLEKVALAGDHLLNLINDVLDMAHIESGKVYLKQAPLNLKDFIQKFVSIIREAAATKAINLTLTWKNIQHENIYADAMHLERALLNILSNAIKYTPRHGKVELIVQQTPNIDGMAYTDFIIKDNGIGISKEFLSHVFETFTREHTTTLSGVNGTGLGLSITKSLIEMMDGTLEIESEQGVGTTVTCHLTFNVQDKFYTFQKDNSVPEVPLEISKSIFKGKRVLLVEDNELNREIAVDNLQELGFLVDEVENGAEALQTIKESKPGYYTLVLMDIQMPVMDGYEACSAIRKLGTPEYSQIPIIAMTANAFEEDKQKAFQVGMNGHLTKPVDPQKLSDYLAEFLNKA